jgi:hypothetical protein
MQIHRSDDASRRVLISSLVAAAVLAITTVSASALGVSGPGRGTTPAPTYVAELGARADRMVAPVSLYDALAKLHRKIPAFSRQTGLACSSCHYGFPQLTPFGRLFKLNGYTLTGLQTIGQPGDSAGRESLKLLPIPPLAAMVVTSLTQTSKTLPGTQGGSAAFPQELSVFLAGQITPNIGTFTQFTYSGAEGTIGLDNLDIRYANHGTFGARELIYGLTLHNNPTVQDVWNTVPAWGYPFMSSEASPSPMASTVIDGALEQQVVGLGAYSLFDKVLYAELTAYRSAPQGTAMPLDSSASNVASGLIPYWRLALQHESDASSMMVGTYGFDAHLFPAGVTGPKNHYTDVGVDAQFEERSGARAWIERASYVHEQQLLDAFVAEGSATSAKQTLSTARASVSYVPNLRYTVTLGYFQTAGTTDALLYPSEPITGSATGSPNSAGAIGELNYNLWQNARLGLQYVGYGKFNGRSSAYDVAGGRNASDNNTLFFYAWLAF